MELHIPGGIVNSCSMVLDLLVGSLLALTVGNIYSYRVSRYGRPRSVTCLGDCSKEVERVESSAGIEQGALRPVLPSLGLPF